MSKEQYIYVLKLREDLLNEENWTKEEENIVDKHFEILEILKEDGRLILAGRTLHMDDDSFGIVILSVKDEESGRILMENDPAVKSGIMTAKLHRFNSVLFSEKNIK